MISPDDIRHFGDVDIGAHGHSREKREQRPIQFYASARKQARVDIEAVDQVRDGDQRTVKTI